MLNPTAWAEALLKEGEEILRLLASPDFEVAELEARLERRGGLLDQRLAPEPLAERLSQALSAQDAALLAATRRLKNGEARRLRMAEAGAGGRRAPVYLDLRG